MVLTALG